MKLLNCLTAFFILSVLAGNAIAKINILACEPEWEALAQEIGGKNVDISSATTALQDPHHIEARPSLIAKARNADLIICTGSELEIGWLPLLLRQSGNSKIQVGQPGYFLASEIVERFEVPVKVDRSMGDIHASGNPHVHLDPYRLLSIAEALTKRLDLLDPDNNAQYRQEFDDFSKRWRASITVWEEKAKILKGKKAMVHHRSWSYLTAWLNIEVIADMEPKPGLPPTSTHLVSLLSLVERDNPDFALVAAYQDPKGAQWISNKTGLPVAILPYTVGGNSDATNLFGLYDSTIDILLAKLK